jgi:hypothetical protein
MRRMSGSSCQFQARGADDGAGTPVQRRRDPLLERRTFDELQDERGDAGRIFNAVDGADVRMIQRGKDSRFALESREPFGIGGNRRREDLNRDLAEQLRVAGAIDLAHAA